MLLEDVEGGVEVGDLAEPTAWHGAEGVAAGELLGACALDPGVDGAGVFEAGVGAHMVERGQRVGGEVLAEAPG